MLHGVGFVNTFEQPPQGVSLDPSDFVTEADRAAAAGYRVQPIAGQSTGGVMAWLQQNTMAVYIGAAAIAAMAILKGRR